MNPPPERLTPKQVAVHFGYCNHTIYNWIEAGVLPHYRIRNRIYILVADLKKFEQSCFMLGKPDKDSESR